MVPEPTSCAQATLPSPLLILSTDSFSPSIVVRKMLSPQIAGVLAPSGNGVFQTTFFASHLTGRPVSVLTLSPVGPRHCGQFPATAVETIVKQATKSINRKQTRAMEV